MWLSAGFGQGGGGDGRQNSGGFGESAGSGFGANNSMEPRYGPAINCLFVVQINLCSFLADCTLLA